VRLWPEATPFSRAQLWPGSCSGLLDGRPSAEQCAKQGLDDQDRSHRQCEQKKGRGETDAAHALS